MAIQDCRLIELPQVHDQRGNLTFVEGGRHVPFDIQRAYYLYDVPAGSHRGGHAHRGLYQLLIAMSGSFDITLDDGFEKKKFHLARPHYGLLITPMVWREMDNFSGGSVCMVLASAHYDEADYYRDYDQFCTAARAAAP
ncbi:MAG: FdtA/QdtA family cupin domain-containing protein [Pseudomonadota bacterium]|jgi:dTDP-4-dehydrorhamnose 3,5-epimerase-like enzyme|nr:FdtA/QdtA family cupin domain-containing protein [Pseudomonadota bacterium]